MIHSRKTVKALISGLLADDDARIDRAMRELTESMVPHIEESVTKVLVESVRGNTNV